MYKNQDESGWWLGKLEKTGVVGWFAPDLVVPLEEQITPASNHSSNKNNKFSFDDQESKTNTNTPKNTKTPKKSPKKSTKTKAPKSSNKSSSKTKAPPKATKSTSTSSSTSSTTSSGSKKKKSPPKKKTKKTKASPPKKNNDDDSKMPSNMGDEPSLIVPYKDLKNKKLPSGVNKAKLENYLSNKEFFEIFKCSRAEFAKKPGWKQKNLKKEKGLF